jgi:hypothetical protein
MDLTLLDVAIGLVMIYTLLSLVCSTINEGLSSFFALRANTLKGALDNLLGSNLAKQVYCHHLVQGLVQPDIWGRWKWTKWIGAWKRKPSYIPTRTFVLTLLDATGQMTTSAPDDETLIDSVRTIAAKSSDENEKRKIEDFIGRAEAAFKALSGGTASFPQTVEDFRLAVEKIPDGRARQALLALIDDAKGDFEKLKANLGNWFDASMERVSGWYRRRVKLIILVLAVLVSVGFGIDTVYISRALWTQPVLRAALVKAAEERVQNARTGTDQTPAGQQQSGNSAPNPGDAPLPGSSASGSPSPQVDKIAKEVAKTQEDLTALSIPQFPISEVRQEQCSEDLQTEFSQLTRDQDFEKRKKSLLDQCVKASKSAWLSLLWFWLKRHALGCFLTAAALSLGAPFWFDLLNKLVNLRSAGEKPESVTAKPAQS